MVGREMSEIPFEEMPEEMARDIAAIVASEFLGLERPNNKTSRPIAGPKGKLGQRPKTWKQFGSASATMRGTKK